MIILLGVPGSGKSTQAELLVNRGKLRWLSMGEVFRQKATPKQREQMLQGKLINSVEATQLLNEELKDLGDNPQLVLDGFPRYTDQAEWLLAQNKEGNLKVTAVVYLFVDKEIVKERMLLRGRMDDNTDTISKRFDEFEQTSLPAIGVLKTGGIPIIEINADQTPQKIHADILKELQILNIEA
jgi:adenylate kinase